MFGFNRPFVSGRTACSDPRNPNYDDGREDAIADEAIEGTWSLKHAPCELLRALADFVGIAGEHDADAVRELLRPLFLERQSYAMRKLHAEFSRSEQALELAAEVLQIA